ncbi:hypothetical protein MMB17_04330 [Methylobacterium organophilum]|uniref:hypothetical protein n=1 Tax=Methylobacterium organophilum TaxID=410 RepID=UPI001F1314F9|nr:hypothetical protein [Methylobacterium organophilum]UMY18563.1 hypothetical protein MMB17_04330 [Methylobacterium organophilum]
MTARNRPARTPAALLALSVLGLAGACSPARAAGAEILLPWGDALAAGLQALGGIAAPALAAAAAGATARLAGPLRFLVTSTLVERLVRNATDYALNAVAGAARGRTLSVPIGSAVIAQAVQRALDQAPAWLVRAAGGETGLAEKVFRSLPLEAEATRANTLAPALARP